MMKKALLPVCLIVSMFFAMSGSAQVEYVKVCSLYGAGFHYIPGTDVCLNESTGDARQQTAGGTWRTLLPYPEGKWTTNPRLACNGKLVKVGTYASTDFTLNAWDRKETPPFELHLASDEFLSKVIMSGGFYNPRFPHRGGSNSSGISGSVGLCVRSKDPTVFVPGLDPENPPFGNGLLPIGCVANSRIVNMPASYSISTTASYPSIFYNENSDHTVSGPFVYGKQLVVTTDIGAGGPNLLTYLDPADSAVKPLAGSLTVWVCVHGNRLLSGRP